MNKKCNSLYLNSYQELSSFVRRIEKTVPGQLSLEQGLNVYYKYYSEESVKDCGVVAIELELVK